MTHAERANSWKPLHGGWTRQDVSEVGPLGAYAARQCPVRTQWRVLQPTTPAEPPTLQQRLAEGGREFEHEIVLELLATVERGFATVGNVPPADRERRTQDLMTQGAPVIVHGRLRIDHEGRRVAEPDLLIRVGDTPEGGVWRYRPGEIKHHSMLVDGDGADVVVWPLEQLAYEVFDPKERDRRDIGNRDSGKAKPDLLQLAHYHRALQACGHAMDGPAWAVVIGSEEQLVWYRLDEPLWQTPAKSDGRKRRTRTSLEVYDFEFAFRLDIAAVAEAYREDPNVPLLVEPVQISECPSCPWRSYCGDLLDARQDVSLLPGLGWTQWSSLSEIDATTIPALASLELSMTVPGLSTTALSRHVDDARARLGDSEAYLRRGVTTCEVPRADIEVDVDMENAEQVYLWGAWVVDRVGAGVVAPGYHAFVDWQPSLDLDGAAELFEQFWAWLTNLRATCYAQGLSFAAYCWSGPSAEDVWLRRYGQATGREVEVETFLDCDQWVDLERVWRDQLVTGHRTSVKTVAQLTGFSWEDDDPGGGQSMVWYETAISPDSLIDERQVSRDRLLQYNQDDVRATVHVREWMDAHANLPSIDR